MRGIVISPIKILGKTAFSAGGQLESNLRNYILYWDKIDIPQNNLIAFGNSPEVDFLKSAGVVQQTRVEIAMSGEMNRLYMLGQLKVFEENNRIEKGKWSLGQENISLVLPEEFTTRTRSIELDLYNRLPIPTTLVSFHDILHYKFKRKDELTAFRALMDEFYLTIINSADSERSVEVASNRVIVAMSEIERTMNESKISKFKKGIKVSLDIPGAIKAAGIGGLVTGALTSDVVYGAFIGGASKLFNIDISETMQPRKIPDNLKDYAYLYYANKGYQI